jgi:hypothetical protein
MNILLTKKKKWEQENEIRFIAKRQEVNNIIHGHITEIIFGADVPVRSLNLIEANIIRHCNANNIEITKI